MKQIKIVLLAAAIFIGVGGAFANSKKDPACADHPQYFKFGFNYYPAGEYGVNYICLSGPGVCTYYNGNPYNPNSYIPCRTGIYFPIIL